MNAYSDTHACVHAGTYRQSGWGCVVRVVSGLSVVKGCLVQVRSRLISRKSGHVDFMTYYIYPPPPLFLE